jgi:sulfate adenylyltransferase (ADP) / adenylylsulfatase
MRHYAFTGKPLGLVSTREPSRAPRTPQKDCVFCKIIASEGEDEKEEGGEDENENRNEKGKKSNELVFSTPELVVFDDHRPAATRHLLVCPREHIDGLYDLEGERDLELLDEMIRVAEKIVLEAAAEAASTSTSTSSSSTSSASATKVKLGFHIPPWNSVDHLHLHAFLLPHTGGIGQRIRFAETPGGKARLWFATAEQVRARLVARNREAKEQKRMKK